MLSTNRVNSKSRFLFPYIFLRKENNKNMKFYRCNTCGQIFSTIVDKNITPVCCNTQMEEIKARTNEEGLNEKHIPVYRYDKNNVIIEIGSTLHPMNDDHYIEWVVLVTNKGKQKRELKPGNSPRVIFNLDKDENIKEIYAYCNIHSLWKKEVNDTSRKTGNKGCGCNLKV